MGKVDFFEVSKRCGAFSEETCRFYFKQLLSALQHCHRQKVAHADIKLENVIFDNTGNLKLIDFGLSHKIKHTDRGRYPKLLGTVSYMAPEV